jgi:hypothetical protein
MDGKLGLNCLFRFAAVAIWLAAGSCGAWAAAPEAATPEAAAPAADALRSVRVSADDDTIDLSRAVRHSGAQGDHIQVSTAPGPDGIVRRIEVSAVRPGDKTAWIVFALTNDSTEQLTRLIWAPHCSGPTSAHPALRRSRRAKAARPSARIGSIPTCSG